MPVHSTRANLNKAQLREAITAALESIKSQRPVRKVVTPTGRRVRGVFPSLKAPGRRTNFESGLEELMLCVCEVATSVRRVQTHPYVLQLGEPPLHYTPDAEIETEAGLCLLEAKGDIYLRTEQQKDRIRRIHRALADQGVPFAVILSSDVSESLIRELRTVLRERPQPKHARREVVLSQIPGLEVSAASRDLVERWVAAGKACDALLERLMKRGPDETICLAAQ